MNTMSEMTEEEVVSPEKGEDIPAEVVIDREDGGKEGHFQKGIVGKWPPSEPIESRVHMGAEYSGELVTDGSENLDCGAGYTVERVIGAACAKMPPFRVVFSMYLLPHSDAFVSMPLTRGVLDGEAVAVVVEDTGSPHIAVVGRGCCGYGAAAAYGLYPPGIGGGMYAGYGAAVVAPYGIGMPLGYMGYGKVWGAWLVDGDVVGGGGRGGGTFLFSSEKKRRVKGVVQEGLDAKMDKDAVRRCGSKVLYSLLNLTPSMRILSLFTAVDSCTPAPLDPTVGSAACISFESLLSSSMPRR
uniref:(California timema) hypothetical protein n=1 Tax=Timema californicum TaxID=61474 RepID=A0A7R9J4Z4_TIMCA|nr:unnamed protein product [Timema californicum]